MPRSWYLRPLLAVLGSHALLAPLAIAGGLAFSLLPPAPPRSDGTSELQLVALNTGTDSVPISLPDHLSGTLTFAGQTRSVELTTTISSSTTIDPGRFKLTPLHCVLPPEIHGPVMLTVTPPTGPALQIMIESARPTAGSPIAHDTPPARRALEPSNTESILHRYFAERFGPHEPVYFIYGADDPVAKLQFSLKYRLLEFDKHADRPPRKTLQFGYTQRSLWDINGTSSPFYDTSYIPEMFFESIAAPVEDAPGFYHGLGLQTGFLHESNGRDGLDSRSLNLLFVRPFFLLGSTERWHAIVAPELFLYVGAMDDNPRLKDYRGYGRLRCALGYGDGPSLTILGYCGKDFDHPSMQLDFAVPLRFALLDFKTFLLIQYFNGYGESLRDYEKHSQTVRAGMALVR